MSTFHTQRELPFAPAAVFAAIQDPTRLAKWWGPNGFTNVFDAFEFKPGGQWVFSMIGPDCTCYANQSVFQEIEPNHQVVIQHVSQPQFVLTITLQAHPNGTLVDWKQVFSDAAVANAVRHIVEPANEQNLDRLTAELQN